MRLVLVNNYKQAEKTQEAVRNLTKCTGETIQLVDRKTPDFATRVLEKDPDIVFLSGSTSLLTRPGTRNEYEAEMDLVRKAAFPIIGICFGHQIIGTAFGAGMTDLGKMVKGFERVNILGKHPIFNGLPSSIEVVEAHRQILDGVPDGFARLAESGTSQIEAMCHQTRPIYSFQFHPERADEARPHGRMIIQNLLKLATR